MGIQVIKLASTEKLQKQMENAALALNQAVADEVDEMIHRTEQGRDINDKAFLSYAPSTIKQKVKTGRHTSPVNLTQTGQMLQSIVQKIVTKTASRATIQVSVNGAAQEQKALANITGKYGRSSKTKPRKFFGFNKKQLERIQKRVLEKLK